MLHASVVHEPSGSYRVVIRYLVTPNGREDTSQLSVSIPCQNYDHARRVAEAYNKPE